MYEAVWKRENLLTMWRIWHNWRRKKTDGLPGLMIMLWASCMRDVYILFCRHSWNMLGAVPFGIYSIVQVSSHWLYPAHDFSNNQQNFNIPIQVQPQCFGLLCLVCWGQTLVYHKWVPEHLSYLWSLLISYSGWRTWTASLITIILAVGFGVVEAILILTLRVLHSKLSHYEFFL